MSSSRDSVADGIVSGANVRRSLDNKEFKEKPMELLQDRCDVTVWKRYWSERWA